MSNWVKTLQSAKKSAIVQNGMHFIISNMFELNLLKAFFTFMKSFYFNILFNFFLIVKI